MFVLFYVIQLVRLNLPHRDLVSPFEHSFVLVEKLLDSCLDALAFCIIDWKWKVFVELLTMRVFGQELKQAIASIPVFLPPREDGLVSDERSLHLSLHVEVVAAL